MNQTLGEELLNYSDERGMFFARIVDGEKWLHLDPSQSIEEHETVLRPILRCADACYAYGLEPESKPLAAVADIATKDKGKYRIALEGDPISGREYFWNADSGQRGTIVVLVPISRFPMQVFRHCEYASVMNNPSAGHTPSAFRFAQKAAEDGTHAAFCFSRNNGFEWMDVVLGKGRAAKYFREAHELCGAGSDT